jgi:hypothetical protein
MDNKRKSFKSQRKFKLAKVPTSTLVSTNVSPQTFPVPVAPISESSSVKLTKQERRNINKQKRASVSIPLVKASQNQPSSGNISVYKRETEYPESVLNCTGPWDRFVTPNDPTMGNILNTSYKGLVVCPPCDFEDKFHADFQASMEGLDQDGFYQFDITQPAGLGTKSAKTYVTRCLVGDEGTTYKYLGLRMFSIPWRTTDSELTSKHAEKIGELNKTLIARSECLLKKMNKPHTGSCQYNLTLINR